MRLALHPARQRKRRFHVSPTSLRFLNHQVQDVTLLPASVPPCRPPAQHPTILSFRLEALVLIWARLPPGTIGRKSCSHQCVVPKHYLSIPWFLRMHLPRAQGSASMRLTILDPRVQAPRKRHPKTHTSPLPDTRSAPKTQTKRWYAPQSLPLSSPTVAGATRIAPTATATTRSE